jgi:hypothetical protein
MTADVEEAFRERADALAAQDWAVVEAQLHEDFVYTNSLGERMMKQGYLAFLRDGPLRWNRQWLEDILVTVVDDTAVVTGLVFDDVVVDGQDHVLTFTTTQTYTRVDGQWRYLAGQTAPIDLG